VVKKAHELNVFHILSNAATTALTVSAALIPWLGIPGQEKWKFGVGLLWSFGDDTLPNTATGSCRQWNDDITALKTGGGNFSQSFMVAAALYFIVFVLAFVAFVMSVLQYFKIVSQPFGKGLVGLIYQTLVVAITLIATIIGAVKFQEIQYYTWNDAALSLQKGSCQYDMYCSVNGQNGSTRINLCSATSPTVSASLPGKVAWGFGVGVAAAACVVSAFQLFVQFRHYAHDSRTSETKGDGSAA